MSTQLEAEQAARLQEAERRWLASSRVRLRYAAAGRRSQVAAPGRTGGVR